MKKLSIAFVFSMVVVLLVASMGQAALPGTDWWTSFYVQNIGAGPGSITMTAYDKDSATTYGSSTFPIARYNMLTYNPGVTPSGSYIGFTNPLPAGFVGSVVLSSDVTAASVAEVANYANGTITSTGTASARYQGAGSTAVDTTLLAPSIKHNYASQTTTLHVQAAGSDVSATITYSMNDGSTHTQTTPILANRMFIFDPANATPPVASTGCGTDANVSPCSGSAKIVATGGPIAGVVVEHPHTGSPAAFALSTRLATPNDQGTIIFAPTIKNDYVGGVAGLFVLNTGTAEARVRITITGTVGPGAGNTYTNEVNIAPGKSYLFSKWLNNLGGLPAGTFAAAVVESITDATHTPQPLLGTGYDSRSGLALPGGSGKTMYSAFAQAAATTNVAAPIVKEYASARTGGLTIQNVGTAPTIIFIEYYDFATGTAYKFSTTNTVAVGAAINTANISNESSSAAKFTKEAGAVWTWASLSGKTFSAIAYTTSGHKVVILAGENTPSGYAPVLDTSNYEGVNH